MLSAAVLSAAVAAATCVCRTELCTLMYIVLKYSLCLILLECRCACNAVSGHNPDVHLGEGFTGRQEQSHTGSLRMEIVSPEVFLQSIVGCVTGGLVLVVGGEGQVKARGSCS